VSSILCSSLFSIILILKCLKRVMLFNIESPNVVLVNNYNYVEDTNVSVSNEKS